MKMVMQIITNQKSDDNGYRDCENVDNESVGARLLEDEASSSS